MTHRIEGWVIIDSRSGERWGGLYETERGAVSSWNTSRFYKDWDLWQKKVKFHDQDVYILQPLLLLGDY